MTEWKTVKLGDICSISTGKRPLNKETHISQEYPIPVYGGNGISWFTNETLLDKPVILTGRVGTIGTLYRVKKPCWVSDNALLISPKRANFDFVFYILKLSNFTALNRGSTQPLITQTDVKNLEIPLPPLDVQKRIAGILGALDDQIDVLRRENVVLEQMAQAVFQSWFVDFDIVRAKAAGTPESEVCEKYHITPELYALFPSALTPDNLPLGWEKKKLGDEFKIVMGQSPAGDTYNENRKGMPFFQGRRDFGFRYPTNRVYCTAPTRFAEKGDVLVSVRAPVGDLNIATEKCCIGRGVASVRHLSNSTAYAFCQLKTLSNQFDVFNGDGTVFGCIGKDAFLALPFVSAPREVLEKTLPYLDSFENKIFSNTQQIRALSATRDALLPKLMNGEIEV